MRADRLLMILLLLQAKGRMTARELAGRLEVTERTVYRDMEALSAAGVPVVSERGRGGGWALLEGYRTRLTGLTGSEAQTLFLGQPEHLLADLGMRNAAEGALLKLLAALPEPVQDAAASMRDRIHIDAAGWQRQHEDVDALPAIQDALWQGRRLRFLYSRGRDEPVERIADPLGLVAKGSVWYLVAGVDEEPRTYRVSRIAAAEVLDAPAFRPPDFDLAAYWAQSTADFVANLPHYIVTLRAKADALDILRYWRFVRVLGEAEPDADGWIEARVDFDVEEQAMVYLLGLGPRVAVVDPPGLRDRIVAEAHALIAFYATS